MIFLTSSVSHPNVSWPHLETGVQRRLQQRSPGKQKIRVCSIPTMSHLTGIRISGPGWGTGPGGSGGGPHTHCCRCSIRPQSRTQSWTDTGLKLEDNTEIIIMWLWLTLSLAAGPVRRAPPLAAIILDIEGFQYWSLITKQAFTSSSQYPPDFTAQLLFPHSRFPAH